MSTANIYDLVDTWNDGATTFNGIRLNVTDTASDAASSLLDLQVGGVSRFRVGKGAGAFFETNLIEQRNGTNPQAFNLYNTFTDASNYERGFMRWNSNVLEIGTEAAGTGAARALEFKTDGVTRVVVSASAFSATTLAASFANYVLPAAGNLVYSGLGRLSFSSNGVLRLLNVTQDGFDRVQFGGTTSLFPALKRSTTSLQARLADDSAFTNMQGKLTTETAYTAGAPTPDGYLVLYDSNGTAYKVPAEAL